MRQLTVSILWSYNTAQNISEASLRDRHEISHQMLSEFMRIKFA